MCGIIGRIDSSDISSEVLSGLKKLEYRGYDSAGLAVLNGSGIQVLKKAGTVDRLVQLYKERPIRGHVAIAHTRWATHGGVNDTNAHPHLSCDGSVAVIHNGIIENFNALKDELVQKGHRFTSQTDTEVVAHLMEDYLKQGKGLMDAGLQLARVLEGQYALVIMSRAHPDSLLSLRHKAPLIIGVGDGFQAIASDVLGFIDWTNRAIFLEDDSICLMTRGQIDIRSLNGAKRSFKVVQLAEELSKPEKESYEHYTLKEIYEQPEAVVRVLNQDAGTLTLFRRQLQEAKRVFFVAAGTSYHASLIAKEYLARNMAVYSEVILASEYKSYLRWFDDETVLVAVSQSGETMDVLEAVRAGKEKGCSVLGVVNHSPSTLERMSDVSVNLRAGQEVGVAATKSFTSQIALFYLISKKGVRQNEIEGIAASIEQALKQEQAIIRIAEVIASGKDVYYLGRGLSYPIALEGALKMKELAYIHAEGLAAGELKHGPLALIDRGVPLILINPVDESYQDSLSNGMEVKARGGLLIGVSSKPERIYDYFIKIPEAESQHYPLITAVPMQLLAYHTARLLRAEIDKPRNLAKSVTVK
ncbi:MAG: glutamine--fructose-6-phosphate transaminase (isomerizing) [Conexivisphaerales archaeon]